MFPTITRTPELQKLRSVRVICGVSSSALKSLQAGYVLGLLSGCKSIKDMNERGYLPYGKSYSCQLLAADEAPHQHALARRLPGAPTGGYLAVDLLTVPHEGVSMEGIGRHYSSSQKGLFWGHMLTSCALVYPDKDPYLLRTDPFLNPQMSTETYPSLTASEALLTVAGDVVVAGYELKGVLCDAQFTTRLALRSLQYLPAGIIGRFRTNTKIRYQGELVSAKALAERHPPGVARWYRKLKRYVKRLRVELPEVGEVDLVIIWKAQGYGWHLSVLISTVAAGVQEVIRAWDARWSQEVSHRLRKQNLALANCQCLAFAAQLQHADLVTEAFNLMREERQRAPSLTWKQAQQVAAERLKRVLTEPLRKAA